MYFENFLPFLLEEGYLERNIKESVKISDVYCPITSNRSLDDIEKDMVIRYDLSKRIIKVIHVLPLNIKVFWENDLLSYYLKSAKNNEIMNMDVTYINYEDVARNIDIEEKVAFVLKNGARLVEEGVQTDVFINSASNGLDITEERLLEYTKELDIELPEKVSLFDLLAPSPQEKVSGEVKEELDLDDLFNNPDDSWDIKTSSEDHIYKWLDGYFKLPEGIEATNDNGREVVPLLIGPTGVFKSATIKELCKKYDYRLVDFRVAFTSRLDYSGLYQTEVIEGESYSYSCPMEEIVTCSDGFRQYCFRATEKLQETLNRGTLIIDRVSTGSDVEITEAPITDENREKIQNMIDQYEHYKKTPVLFFDEITRNKNQGVEGILMNLLNQKKFGTMTLNGCKFVAATNLNLEHEDMNEIYDVNYDLDKAYSNRFFPLNVYPSDVKDRWLEWADLEKKDKEGEGILNIHPLIRKFLDKYDNFIYDESGVIQKYNDPTVDDQQLEAAATPFPNYRTWDITSDMLYSREDTKSINLVILQGLIGEKTAETFMQFLEKNGYTRDVIDQNTDDVGKFLHDNLDAGIPALLMGPSSLGKTARVKSYARKVEQKTGVRPIIIPINLAEKDNADVMGMPVKQTVSSFITKDLNMDDDFDILSEDLNDISKDIRENSGTGFVDRLTTRSPDSGNKRIFMDALANNIPVIIFFDECNRVVNSSMMSAMFEAISDHKLFGIDYTEHKHMVKVIAACNLGNEYVGAKGLDPALSARFSVYWKKDFDARDFNSYKDYLEREVEEGVIDGTILEYLKTLDTEKGLEFLRSAEKRELQKGEPTSRMLYQMSKDIKNMRGKANEKGEFESSIYNGTILFKPMLEKKAMDFYDTFDFNPDMNQQASLVNDIAQSLKVESTRWESLLTDATIEIRGKYAKASELLNGFYSMTERLNEFVMKSDKDSVEKALKSLRGILDSLRELDDRVSTTRKSMFESYAGVEFTRDFLPFFNERFGGVDDVEITIEMLDDVSLINGYFTKQMPKLVPLAPDDKITTLIGLIDEFYTYWGDNLVGENYAKFFEGVTMSLDTKDNVIMLLRKLGIAQDPFLVKAESIGDTFIKNVLRSYPTTISDADIEKIRASMSQTLATGMQRPKLL